MPRGVYDRKKIKQRRDELRALAEGKNGNSPAFTPTVEDVDDLAPVKPHDGVNWGKPYEVAAEQLDHVSLWDELYADAMLRLERTSASKAVVYPFTNERDAERAYSAISDRVRKHHGSGFAPPAALESSARMPCR